MIQEENYLKFTRDLEKKEIVVQQDLSLDDLKDCPADKREVFGYIMKHNTNGLLRVIFNPLRGDFAAFKNHLTAQCTGDYIFQIDADELPHETLIANLPQFFQMNPDNDVFLVPRLNTVEGLTAEEIALKSMRIAADKCVYTNSNFIMKKLQWN